VLHLYLGEEIKDINVAKRLIKKCSQTQASVYILRRLSPYAMTTDILPASASTAPRAARKPSLEPVVGYLRPIQNYNTASAKNMNCAKSMS
jgi:hypothetical protein